MNSQLISFLNLFLISGVVKKLVHIVASDEPSENFT